MEKRPLRPELLVALLIPLALGACAPKAQPEAPAALREPLLPQAEAVAKGRMIAETTCARCHAIGAFGESPEPMAPPFRQLSLRYPIASLEEAFAEGIMTGHPMMPTFKFSPEQTDALVAYLNSVQERRGG